MGRCHGTASLARQRARAGKPVRPHRRMAVSVPPQRQRGVGRAARRMPGTLCGHATHRRSPRRFNRHRAPARKPRSAHTGPGSAGAPWRTHRRSRCRAGGQQVHVLALVSKAGLKSVRTCAGNCPQTTRRRKPGAMAGRHNALLSCAPHRRRTTPCSATPSSTPSHRHSSAAPPPTGIPWAA